MLKILFETDTLIFVETEDGCWVGMIQIENQWYPVAGEVAQLALGLVLQEHIRERQESGKVFEMTTAAARGLDFSWHKH